MGTAAPMRVVFHAADTRPERWVRSLEGLLEGAEVWAWNPQEPPRPADYAVVWAPPQALADAHPGLRAVFNLGAGVDALLRVRWPSDVTLVRLDDAGMAVQMAERSCEAVIRHFRELDAYEAQARDARWKPRAPRQRSQWPVGVMGTGVLGERVLRALAGFDFPVRGWSRTPREFADIPGWQGFHGEAGLAPFLAASRHLVCLLPLTPATEGILCQRNLSQLQPGGLLIHFARGAHLVDEDLLALLDSGHLDGAVLDVFGVEPLPEAHAFWRHPRVRVTPHVAAQTLRDESLAQIASRLLAFHHGRPVRGRVDPLRGY